MNRNGIKARKNVLDITSKAIIVVFLLSHIALMFLPIIWMFLTSFRDAIDYYTNEFGFPNPWTLENFQNVLPLLKVQRFISGIGLVEYNVANMFYYSFVWAFGTSFVSTFWYMMCGYIFAKYEFRLKNFLYGVGIFVMIAPIVGGLTSGLVMYKRLHVYNNMLVQILLGPGCSFSGGTFLIFYAMWRGVSSEYRDAGFIDGAGHFTVFLRIMLPFLLPFTLVNFILNFLGFWNDYGVFLTMLPGYANLAFGMYLFQQDAASYGATPPQVMAGFIYICIPSVILYLSTNKLIVTKANASGLKG